MCDIKQVDQSINILVGSEARDSLGFLPPNGNTPLSCGSYHTHTVHLYSGYLFTLCTAILITYSPSNIKAPLIQTFNFTLIVLQSNRLFLVSL